MTTQPGGHADSPLIGENSYAESVILEEGHDYYVVTIPPGGRGNEYSSTLSVRNGEVIELQEDDFAKAVEIIGGLLRDPDRPNLQLMSLSPWNLDRAVEAAVAAEGAAHDRPPANPLTSNR